MTTEEQIVKWFADFRKENPKFENEYVDNGQLIYWLAQKEALKISSNTVLADSCRFYEQDNTTAMNCKHCGKGKYMHGNSNLR